MGIYDRDYDRDDDRRDYEHQGAMGVNLSGPRTLTTNLVIFIFLVYGVQLLTQPAQPAGPGDQGWFTNTFSLTADLPAQPWWFFQLVTYGFLHSPDDLRHILFNMFGLWMFGRAVEQRYGRREHLLFFLTAVALAGLVWIAGEYLAAGGQLRSISLIGASGGVAAVLLLFAVNFPRQMVFLFGVVPMPAWVFAVLFVGIDLLGAMGRGEAHVAYTAHLGGAAFAVLYFKSRIRLERWLPTEGSWNRLRPGPKLRVHFPDHDDDGTDNQVDEILKKIQEHGQESLTRRERKILEQASREYQKRRRL